MTPQTDKKTTPQNEEPTPSKKDDYIELKLPKLPPLPKVSTTLSPVWVLLLVALAYLLGIQTAKLTYIEQKMKEGSITAQQAAQPQNPQEPVLGAKVDISEGTLPALGKKDAKITMVEFSDFQCPFCERFYKETFPQLKKDYIDTGKVKFTFRHLPLDIHPLAPKAAEASECANDQGKFWEYHDTLFNNFNTWSGLTLDTLDPELQQYAADLGLNAEEFTSCLTSGKYTEKVTKDKTEGQNAGATGTPSFFINGKLLVGAMPYATFKTLLDQELK
jgi:protein-disulfide isomerase